ncbi:tRNA preQ1(34) S-adenosylmethionine ribosyltransferase-isomerase QueA [Rhodovibrionaceae bacterium A322]
MMEKHPSQPHATGIKTSQEPAAHSAEQPAFAAGQKLSDFDFELPKELVAQRPVSPRHAAKLLHVSLSGDGEEMRDRQVLDLPDLLNPGDLLVFNDTKVIPARLFGHRGEARVEVTLHKRETLDSWRAFARPAKKLKLGDRFDVSPDLHAEVTQKGDGGEVTLTFNCAGEDLFAALEAQGKMPLPPYIRREDGADDKDKEDYQTLFAREKGAVAAPTAGLHFTEELITRLKARGIKTTTVTLHVGAGTFLPVKVEDLADHRMHAEWGEISTEAAQAIAETKASGGRVVAVGTTSLRLLESAAHGHDPDKALTENTGHPDHKAGPVPPWSGETRLFILPGYTFKAVDLLMTNFHLPKSTLFMLVSAFAGKETMARVYHSAIEKGYRFYSYGDSSLLERR